MLLTDREQVISDVCQDLFTRYMTRPTNTRLKASRSNINDLLLSCLFNRQVGWQKAMSIVPELKRRAGMDDIIELLTTHTEPMIEWLMFAPELGSKLHRFYYFASLARGCALTIRDEYDGDARNIFRGNSPDGTVTGTEALNRVLKIKGFGTKTGSLYLRMAVLVYNLELWDGTMSLMPANDRWVIRVGCQLGLWDEDATFKQVCEVAKRLCISCPAALDSLFVIGTDWECGTDNMACRGNGNSDGEECPLLGVCPSRQ